jgi:propionate catabolism operon transcriptional regulator
MQVAPELTAASRKPPLAVATIVKQDEDMQSLLARFGGNRNALAKHLGISRTTLWRRLNCAPG